MEPQLEPPPNSILDIWQFKSEPWPHQAEGCQMIIDQPSTMLADDMGTGKSKQVVDAICNLVISGDLGHGKRTAATILIQASDVKLTLIMCPKSVCAVWPQQFERHATKKIDVLVLAGKSVKARVHQLKTRYTAAMALGTPFVVVINYDAVWRTGMAKLIQEIPWQMIACDESHRIKSARSKASRFAANLPRHEGQKRVCLSGTPLAHSLLDAFGQYRFLDPNIFGHSLVRFRSRYCVMGGWQGKQVLSFQNTEEFNRKFYSIARRVKASDVLTLPERQDIDVPVALGDAEWKAYRQMDADLVADVQGGIVTAANAGVRLIRLQQITSGHSKREEDGAIVEVGTSKQEALADIFTGFDPTEKVVVFCRFTRDLNATVAACGLPRLCFELSGRVNELRLWSASKHGSVLAVQIQAGGVGIDLTAASKVIYFSMGTSLADYEQSRARVHRPGQTKPVTYWHLIATKTRDVTVYRALRRRANVIEEVLREISDDERAVRDANECPW